ncbi:MAG: hypothetical protein HZA66_03430 [Rhodopseudomonas palustris]|uniref:Uncharacterized protein n=1 Tax=Rhodopseudomonas palustris TaxID=1076 RepID=A0A933RTS8_RHOPL|nr:hypothetical protein [Rhodopseudomonas palustris]
MQSNIAQPRIYSTFLSVLRTASRLLWIDRLRFLYIQRIKGFDVPTAPYFDSEQTTAWFMQTLANCRYYLEYGSGGSTYTAAKCGKPFTSVDSDRHFLAAVKDRIQDDALYNENNQNFVHVDIGPTSSWGKPIFLLFCSRERLRGFSEYSRFRTEFTNDGGNPDLILIDGRFRVACALKAIQALRHREGWTIVVDDYVGRDYYKVVENFAKLEFFVGRMAVFKRATEYDETSYLNALRDYENDWR